MTSLELAGVPKMETMRGASFVPVLCGLRATAHDVVFAERNWHVYQLHERAVRTGGWLYMWNTWPEPHNVSREITDQGRLTPA